MPRKARRQVDIKEKRILNHEEQAPEASNTASPILISVPQAAEIAGIPKSFLRKCFIDPKKRPRNVPSPPPYIRRGRAISIIAADLLGWVRGLGLGNATDRRRPGRPTVSERIARRERRSLQDEETTKVTGLAFTPVQDHGKT
jgi:hypothetical protein